MIAVKPIVRDILAGRNLDVRYLRSVQSRVSIIAVFHALHSYPLSRLWFARHENTTPFDADSISLEGMYTLSWARRCGLASLLFNTLLADHKDVQRITTPSHTRWSKQWLIHRGFVRESLGDWVLDLTKKTKGNTYDRHRKTEIAGR